MKRPQIQLLASFLMTLVAFSSESVASSGTWDEIVNDDGVQVWRKKIAGSPFVAFRGETLVDASIKKVLAVLNDQDNKTSWMHRCVANYAIEYKKLGQVIIYNRTGSNFPLVADRDVVVETNLTYDTENGVIDIVAVDTTHKNGPPIDGVVRMKKLRLNWRLTFVSKEKTLVRYEVQTDPGGAIPAWVVNLVSKGVPKKTLAGLKRQVLLPYEKSLSYVDASFDWSKVGL
ncbi:MAG: START domain-containing protein [Myxococcota bacterium]|nr:START domain-containing protein [Myxococcota bacterium]